MNAVRAAAAGVLGAALLSLPAAAAEPYGLHCADYPTRAAAQAAFDAHGGRPGHNWNGLDNDGDGFVCEHHHFPGQPTPPPNPGPGGCAVCSPSPRPRPSVSPSRSPRPGGPGESAEPTEPVPTLPRDQLPVTGPQRVASLVGGSVGLVLLGAGLLGIARHRRRHYR